jgi:hypothetical protein
MRIALTLAYTCTIIPFTVNPFVFTNAVSNTNITVSLSVCAHRRPTGKINFVIGTSVTDRQVYRYIFIENVMLKLSSWTVVACKTVGFNTIFWLIDGARVFLEEKNESATANWGHIWPAMKGLKAWTFQHVIRFHRKRGIYWMWIPNDPISLLRPQKLRGFTDPNVLCLQAFTKSVEC